MYEFKLNTMNQGKQLTLESMLAQLKAAPQGRPFFITFSPAGQLPLPFIKQLLSKLPPECEGLDLGSLIGTAKSLKVIQEICALLANLKLKRLHAEIVLPQRPEGELIKGFITALPKTDYLSLAKNDLYDAPDEVFINLDSVRILDISGNQWHCRWPEGTFTFLNNLSSDTTGIYIDLDPGSEEKVRLAMRKNFFSNLPAHVHTLGLNLYDFQDSISDLIWMKDSVSTLKWIKHWKLPLPTQLESTPSSVKTLDLSAWELGGSPVVKVNTALAQIPKHVTTLILNKNNFHKWSQEHFVTFISQIPSHIECIHLEGNQLFVGKTVEERNQLLKALTPYNTNGRLILNDNDYATESSNKITPQQQQPRSNNNVQIASSPYFMNWLNNCVNTPLDDLPEETETSTLKPN
ncbi:MAG TPA: hypothetical protein PK657_09100 [Legionella sp.]|nr:hypothetical protein [Legionella sp.]